MDLENHLYRNGTRIIKFFLHLSKEERRKRFLNRIDNPDKNWKFSPADDKETARLIVSQVILDTFRILKLSYPKTSEEHQRELKSIRRHLMKEAAGSKQIFEK